MADVKRLLVVDDRYEMLDFLQSMLELTSDDYEVLAVPSAEEALLELRQKDFDLLITDARLPGMSGFDLVRRVRRFQRDIPAIMITAYSSEQGRQEAEDLGAYRYFEKPLDTDQVLTAVHSALYGELIVHADSPIEAEVLDQVVPDAVSKRLETLRADTGATRLALATRSGRLLLKVGHGRGPNLKRLTALMAKNLDNSILLGQELGGDDPTTIQYHAGDRIELYIANVGSDYFLALFFDAQTRRGRMSTIWVFAQRAIKDLLLILPTPYEGATGTPISAPVAAPEPKERAESTVQLSAPQNPAEPVADSESSPLGRQSEAAPNSLEPASGDDFQDLDETVTVDRGELDTFWESAVAREHVDVGEAGALSLEEARRQGLISDELDSEPDSAAPASKGGAKAADAKGKKSKGIDSGDMDPGDFQLLDDYLPENATDLDAFWETALAEEGTAGGAMTDGFSYEEAKRRGLIPKDSESEGDLS